MRNQDKRRAARRRWYYKNRDRTLKTTRRIYTNDPREQPIMSREDVGRIGWLAAKDKLTAFRVGISLAAREKAANKRCIYCGEKMSYEKRKQRSCSRACYLKHRRKRALTSGQCEHCGTPCSTHRKFCNSCYGMRIYCLTTSPETARTSHALRGYLFRTRGYRCESCGLTEWLQKPIPLEIEHINGDADNNKDENLKLLCPNCHALTPTFRSRNKQASASRRKKRRTREFREIAELVQNQNTNLVNSEMSVEA
jgi:hypothetical protein